jgi:outer membrane protein OmpA-like peptidoglycan-associated protein
MIFEKKAAAVAAVFMAAALSAFPQTVVNSNDPLYIVFPANSAELKGAGAELAIQNSQVFIKVAQLLLENPQYRILVDGHANPVIGTAEEEDGSLRPLSVRRAEAIPSARQTSP